VVCISTCIVVIGIDFTMKRYCAMTRRYSNVWKMKAPSTELWQAIAIAQHEGKGLSFTNVDTLLLQKLYKF
jgi:hypothetical protein